MQNRMSNKRPVTLRDNYIGCCHHKVIRSISQTQVSTLQICKFSEKVPTFILCCILPENSPCYHRNTETQRSDSRKVQELIRVVLRGFLPHTGSPHRHYFHLVISDKPLFQPVKCYLERM